MNIKTWMAGAGLLSSLVIVFGSLVFKFILDRAYADNAFVLPENISTLVAGASHAATGISVEPYENIYSVARSGEPIYFVVHKVRKLLKNNPNIDKIVIAVSPIHLSKYVEAFYFNNSAGSRGFVMDYMPLVESDIFDDEFPKVNADYWVAKMKYSMGVPFSYMDDLNLVMNALTNKNDYDSFGFSGGFEKHEGNHIGEQDIEKKVEFFFGSDGSVSDVGIKAIEQIAALQLEYPVDVVFITVPMHEALRSRVPQDITLAFNQLMSGIDQRSSNVSFFNFLDLPTEKDSFLDGDHLNYNGSKVFTEMLYDKGLL